MTENVLKNKSYPFAIKIVNLSKQLQLERKEFVLSKQMLRSGTAIGALIREAEYGQSKIDFIHKLTIALKEANETEYWLCLLKDTNYLELSIFESLYNDRKELLRLLIASIKAAKQSNKE